MYTKSKIEKLPMAISFISILAFSSCNQNEDLRICNNKDLTLNGSYGYSSKSHWIEDNNFSGELRFKWDNSVDGEENMILAITDGTKIYDFAQTYRNFTLCKVTETSNHNISRISMINEPSSTNNLKAGDEIYSYFPIDYSEDILATHKNIDVTMSIPREIEATELNSTTHLIPYAYMAGKGIINENTDILTSTINYRLIPAIIRFRITNSNPSYDFIPDVVRMSGDINTLATIELLPISGNTTYKASESITYSSGNRIFTRLKDVSIKSGETANTYNLVFPTELENKFLTFEVEGLYNGKRVERIATIDASLIQDKAFKSNYCYTFNLNMDENELEIEDTACNPWTGDEEEITTTPE